MAIVALIFGSLAGFITACTGWAFFEWSLSYAFLVYLIGSILSLGICVAAMVLSPDSKR
ncbi:hypothetical protein [Primorskyibacter marinus]|uniref:hypothetical protein n=1 Tax=Primorskyibacter marinus TaxID=1977320 RepID=UPI001300804C|nr:hypothetical protein [Primorskyibacter marinus]